MKPFERPKRLNTDGARVLHDFFDRVGAYPTQAQKKELLLTVNAIPGNEHFDSAKLKDWFKRRRTRTKMPHHSPESEIYSTLRALVAETPSPSETLMKTWAKLLHLELSELQAMINLLDLHELDPQPPTSTPSPDGQRSLITLPPIYHSPSPEPAAIVAHSSPQLSPQTPLKIKLPSPQEIHRTALLLQIGEGMEAAVTRKSPSSLSRAQFNDLFAPYEFRMRYILDEVGNGALKNQGWTPSMVRRH